MDVTPYRALSFDIVGTLIDYRSGALAWLKSRLAQRGAEAADGAILDAFHLAEAREHAARPTTPFTQTLPEVWRHVAARFGVEVADGDGAAFVASIAEWPAFDDSVDALRRLAGRFTLAAVTNADRWGAERMAETLGRPFEVLVSAEEAGAVKPDPRPFELVWARLERACGLPRGQVLQVAQGLTTDVAPCTRRGMPVVWINRSGVAAESAAPDLELASLAAFADHAGV
jgi:2-haloalkanoic acid dehalogenase type II